MSPGAQGMGRFLRARRDALQPEDVGLPREPGRRVPGLRREEVAALAGVSLEYYLRLEQGRDHQPSTQVVAALARALRLDPAGREYLSRLMTGFLAVPSATDETVVVNERLTSLVDRFGHAPTFIANAVRDVLSSNPMARALSSALEPGRNLLLELFAPHVKLTTPGWEQVARRAVANLRLVGDHDSARLQQVVGTLAVRDEDFRRWWARHEVATTSLLGSFSATVDGFGRIDLDYDNLAVPGHPGCVMTILRPRAGTVAEEALEVLAARVHGSPQLL
ncbi:helix-turn-helix transcriptional regulator [Kineococcus sp. SYSU DK002]|uniref:helix-turn-helix transcriptional regulator n=1 Tax=Kineococcus sp. SYSU DK002 TaxID=3383123 RepID=UPI003D7E86F7